MAESQVTLLRSLPSCTNTRLLLFGVRRLAVGGLTDAFAVNALMAAFGMSFRRPLLLLRALMAEMARASQRQISVAPCRCGKITSNEAEILMIIGVANYRPRFAHARLCTLLGTDSALGALSSAQALAQAFADLGRPLEDHSSAVAEPAFPID
jgi:hypothetical protein